MSDREDIERRAFQIYKRRIQACIDGSPEGDWSQAVRELEQERNARHEQDVRGFSN